MELERKNYFLDIPTEKEDGFSRTVQVGPFIYCGGTAIGKENKEEFINDSYGQVKFILENLVNIVVKAGAVKEDVYQVKLYVADGFDREKGLLAFKEMFGEIKPIMTCVTVHHMKYNDQLVSIELNAIKGSSTGEVWEGIKLERTNYATKAPNELKYGYSRMVKIGPFVYIGGTTSVQPDGTVAGIGDACEQNKRVYEKLLGIMERAGASEKDIVKIKKYVTSAYYETWKEQNAYKLIPRDKIVLSRVLVDSLTRPEQIVETEMFAIVGCGGDAKLDEWGNIDFRKKVNIGEDDVWASFVNAGCFVVSGTRHSIDDRGVLIGADDSERQESHVLKSLTEGLSKFGYKPEHMVKLKAYYTSEFEQMHDSSEKSYYEEVYKKISPLYSKVQVASVGRKHEIVEIEMLAMK